MDKIDFPLSDDDREQGAGAIVSIEVPAYSRHRGVTTAFEPDYEIKVLVSELPGYREVVLSANKDGLVSLARLFLTLAQDDVPVGAHIHLTDVTLDPGSESIVIGKAK